MLRAASELLRYKIRATDGDAGKIHDFLFDEDSWTVRYVVVNTAASLSGRKVLIATSALGRLDANRTGFPVHLTRSRIQHSPEIDVDRPITSSQRAQIDEYFGWGTPSAPHTAAPAAHHAQHERESSVTVAEPALISLRSVTGYFVDSIDGSVGPVEDFILDDKAWIVRYLVVDATGRGEERKVLIAPDWIEEVSWTEDRIQVDLSRDEIRESPEYDPMALDREYESMLYDFYGRPKYWV